MKKLSLLITLIVLLPNLLFSQSKEDKIKHLRKKYHIIENSKKGKKYSKQFYEYRCSSGNEHGSVWFVYDKKELKKIEISSLINEENSQNIRYYFWRGKLFFAFHESIVPEFVNESEMIYHHTEHRVYFYDEKPIRCLKKQFSNNTSEGEQLKSENVDNKELDCDNIDYLKRNLKETQKFKDLKNKVSLCIW